MMTMMTKNNNNDNNKNDDTRTGTGTVPPLHPLPPPHPPTSTAKCTQNDDDDDDNANSRSRVYYEDYPSTTLSDPAVQRAMMAIAMARMTPAHTPTTTATTTSSSSSSSSSRLRHWSKIAIVLIATFFLHLFLQQVYVRECRSNVLRVFMYSSSDMCRHLSRIISVIEGLHAHAYKHILTTMIIPGIGRSLVRGEDRHRALSSSSSSSSCCSPATSAMSLLARGAASLMY